MWMNLAISEELNESVAPQDDITTSWHVIMKFPRALIARLIVNRIDSSVIPVTKLK